MLESLISSLLNRFLGSFIENLDSEQLNISLWSGKVVLENLLVKQNLFDSMPLPFTLHYGKVGKILLEIPVINIASSPLKIEIKDIFIFVKPKHFNMWNEKVEIEAFVTKTLQFLDKYEAYLSESTQLEQSNPGMMANLIQNIINNIQLKVSNVYIRVEDELSIPEQPFSLGIIIGSIQARTMNDNWQEDFVTGRDITNKQVTIKDFAVYQNFSNDHQEVFFEYITKDWDEPDQDKKYLRFLKQECNFENPRNNYIINRFQLQVRAALNNNVLNMKPQFWINMALGGQFKDAQHEVTTEEGQFFYFSAQQQQITSLLKLLEYIGNYGKFQAGVIAQFYKREMSQQEENIYMETYLLYKENIRGNQNPELAQQYLDEIRNNYEKQFTYEKLILLRTIATKKFEFEQLKNQEVTKIEDKVKEYEYSKQGYFNSVKGWFGYGKPQEEIEEEKKQIEEFRDKLVRETENTLHAQEEQLEQEINIMKQQKNAQLEEKTALEKAYAINPDYVQFDVMINIPRMQFVLKKEDNEQLIEIQIEKMKSYNQKGIDFLDAQFSLHIFKIIDHISGSKIYPNLVETYLPMAEKVTKRAFTKQLTLLGLQTSITKRLDNNDKLDEKNALNLRFINNARKNKNSALKLTIKSDAQLYIIANFKCINEVQKMFGKAFANQAGMVDYYKNVASEQVFKYVYEGSEFMMTTQKELEEQQNMVPQHASAILDICLNAPVLFIPEDYDTFQDKQVLVLDLGQVIIDSKIVEFNPKKNYKLEENFMLLYDSYNFSLKDFQIIAYDNLSDYQNYKTIKQTKIIKDTTLVINFYYCLETKHPIFPLYEINVRLKSMNIIASDYIAHFMQSLQIVVNEKMAIPAEPEETKQEESESPVKKQQEQESKRFSNIEILDQEEEKLDKVDKLYQKVREVEQNMKKKESQLSIDSFPTRKLNSTLNRSHNTQNRSRFGNNSLNINDDDDLLEFKSCLSQSQNLEEEDMNSARSLPQNARIRMIKKMNEQTLSTIQEKRKTESVAINVILNIGLLDILIQEEIDASDPRVKLSESNYKDQIHLRSRYFQDILRIRMCDLVSTFYQDLKGIQRVSVVLTSFDIQDINMELERQNELKLYTVIPECYSHIMGNPQFSIKQMEDEDMMWSDEDEQKKKFNAIHQVIESNRNSKQQKSRQAKNFSVKSLDFRSCYSGASLTSGAASLNIKEIERVSQVYIRAIIDPDPKQTKKEVDFVFSDLRMIVSLPTFEKLFHFSKKFNPPPSEEERQSMLFEEQQKRFLRESIERNTQASNSADKLGASILRHSISKTRISDYQRKIQEIKIEKSGQQGYFILTNERKTKLKLNGRFKNLQLWIPLDAADSHSRVFQFSLMSQVNYRKDSIDLDFINSVTNDVMITKPQLSREDGIVTLNQLQIQMINRHLLEDDNDEPTIEKLLEPSRVTISYENLIKDSGLNTYMSLDMLVEPFELKVGFREVEFFKKLNENASKFLSVINQSSDQLDLTLDTEIDNVEKELTRFKNREQKELSKQITNQNSTHRTKIKKEEQINVMTVKFRCDTFRFSLMDDTGMQEYPVIFMNLRNLKYDSKVYEDIDDAAVFILKKMGLMKKKNNEEEPYLNTQASVNMEVYYFNMKIQAYEPVLEPWQIEFTQYQEERYISQKTKVTSNQMMNINVTFALMQALTKIQQRMSQTSDDWEDEIRSSQIFSRKTTNAANDAKIVSTKPNPKVTLESFITETDEQSGFIFINRLNIDCKFYIEGQLAFDLRNQIIQGLFGGAPKQSEDLTNFDLEEALRLIDETDPKAHFKKLALYRKLSLRKRTLEKQIEKVTELQKNGQNMRKFRKADELFYLMKQIKNGQNNEKYVPGIEDQILRIDLHIDGLRKIKAIPIELGGVFSFLIEMKQEQKAAISEFQTIKPSIQTVNQTPIAVICKVQFENQNKKEVEFHSSLMFSNNTGYSITICGHKPGSMAKQSKKDSFMDQLLDESSIIEKKRKIIEPNKVFHVPLSWFIKRKSIYIQQKGKFQLLYSDIRECFNPILSNYNYLKPQNFEVFDQASIDYRYISCNISQFKCKPTTLNVPGQFLVSFTPPVCVCNYLFSELALNSNVLKSELAEIESANYTYVSQLKFEEKPDKTLECDSQIQWRFKDADGFYYETQDVPFFKSQKQNQKNQFLNPINQLTFYKNTGGSKIMEEQKGIKIEDESASYSIINLEMTSFNLLDNEYDNFQLRDKVFEKTSAVTLYIYPQAMVVNQTNTDIYLKTLINNNKSKDVLIQGQTNEFFYSSTNKLQMRAPNYQWSKQFDISTLGLTGSVEIYQEKDIIEGTQNVLNYGIIIENGLNEFSKTKIIRIVPRYIIFNNLDDPLIVRQKNQEVQSIIFPKDRMIYNFQNKTKDAFLMLRDMHRETERIDTIRSDFSQNPNAWSSPFSIEDIEDFQVEIQSNYHKTQYQPPTSNFLMQKLMSTQKKVPWYMPSHLNFGKRFLRVSVNTQDDATIFIIVSRPKFPEYFIHNNTDVEIEFCQFKVIQQALKSLIIIRNENRKLKPGQRVPFVWTDQTQAIKKLTIFIEGKNQSYSIDKVKKFNKQFSTPNDDYYVEVMTSGDVRTVEIKSKTVMKRLASLKDKGSSQLAKLFLASFLKKGFIFNIDLKGVGISLIDNEPKEIIYMSIYKIQFLTEKWMEQQTKKDNNQGQSDSIQEANTKYDLKIDHIQIDNILNDAMPVFFCPTRELVKDDDKPEDQGLEQKDESSYTPFIQVMITFSEIQDQDVYIKKYRGLQIQVQEMKLELETGLVNALLKFSYQMQAVQSQKAQFVTGFTLQQHKLTRIDSKRHGSLISYVKTREELCPNLNAAIPEPPNIAVITAKKTYFEFINFGAIKMKITVRFERKAFELKIDDPRQGFGLGSIFYTLFTSVATISESPLTFKELILMHTFTSQENLQSMVIRNYTRQGVLQFYKLIGSSDLLGNPVGLIDKLGTGVFEFFNEPRKGLVKGPKEFVGGVGKGVKSLVTNIVSGSFDSVSKITGSLYGVVKNVSGDQVTDQQLKKPEHVFDGIYQGLKGGGGELLGGLTGIFTKPYQKAKEEGAKGFVKGLGAGLLGAVASPFAATLRLGNNVSTGIKNSAIRLGKGKLPSYGRFRHPRYFNSKSILEPYAEAFAEAHQILRTLNNGQYAQTTIKFFADFTVRKGKNYVGGILIVTDQYLLFVEDFKNLKFVSPLTQILKCEVFQEELNNTIKQSKTNKKQQSKQSKRENQVRYRYLMNVESQKRGVLKIENENYPIIDKVFTILNK